LAFIQPHRPEYFYVSYRNLNHVPLLTSNGIVAAIHPGAFSPIRRVEDVEALLSKYPALRVIFDTAHMKIVGEDPVASLRRLKEAVVAVHLKDWTP
jgi:sugar phosphate isomerase/epimerase